MSESKTPRRPGGRRPIPPLIFLIVLAILAVAVWWQVIRKDDDQQAKSSAECTLTASEQQVAELSNLASIQIVVLNGSGQTGLAASIQAELTGRGFTVVQIGNASGADLGPGQIQYGTGDEYKAKVVAVNFPDFEVDRSNDITDGTIHVVAGPQYAGLADPNQASQQFQALVAEQSKVVAGCPTEEK